MLAITPAPEMLNEQPLLTPAGLPRKIHSRLGDYQITVICSAEESQGKYLEVEVLMAPGGGNDLHYHTTFVEHFLVLEGTLGLQLEKAVIHLTAGERAEAPLRMPHRFFNPSQSQPVRFRVEVHPPRFFEATLRIAHGLANDGLCNTKGIPKSLWHLALLFEQGESYAPMLPHGLQCRVFGVLARIARRLGKDKALEKYYMPPK